MRLSMIDIDCLVIKSCGSDSHGVTVRNPSRGHYLIRLGRSLDLCWMEKMAGGKRELDGRVVLLWSAQLHLRAASPHGWDPQLEAKQIGDNEPNGPNNTQRIITNQKQ